MYGLAWITIFCHLCGNTTMKIIAELPHSWQNFFLFTLIHTLFYIYFMEQFIMISISNMKWSNGERFGQNGLFARTTLQWRQNEHNGVSNHQPHDCLLNHLFRRRSKKTSKLCVTGLCEGNSPVTGEFPAQRASNTENVSIWWPHHDMYDSWDILNMCIARQRKVNIHET